MSGPAYRLSVLGSWRLTADSTPVHLRSREQRVVAVLALRDFESRGALAETLWPGSTRQQALGSLRAAIFNLRREAAGVVAEESGRLTLSVGVTTDVAELGWHLARARTPGVDVLEETITALDVPGLLTGWYEDWVEDEREALRSARLEALTGIATTCLDRGQPDLAHAAAALAIVIDPVAERVCELLIRAHLAMGERLDAVQVFERFRHRVLDEMGVQPSRQLQDLAYQNATPNRGPAANRAVPDGMTRPLLLNRRRPAGRTGRMA